MKTSSILSVAALAITALAQDLSSLPSCAQSCALNAIVSSGCGLTDFACICASSSFLTTYVSCSTKSCGTADFEAAVAFGTALCASVGVDINPNTVPGVAATSAATSAASSAAAVVSTSAAVVPSSAAVAPSSAAASSSDAVSSSASSVASTACSVASIESSSTLATVASVASQSAVTTASSTSANVTSVYSNATGVHSSTNMTASATGSSIATFTGAASTQHISGAVLAGIAILGFAGLA